MENVVFTSSVRDKSITLKRSKKELEPTLKGLELFQLLLEREELRRFLDAGAVFCVFNGRTGLLEED